MTLVPRVLEHLVPSDRIDSGMYRTAPLSNCVAEPAAEPITTLVIDSPTADAVAQPVTVGVPFPRGRLPWPTAVTLAGAGGRPLPCQVEPLGRWPDGTVRWLLLDTIARDLQAGPNHWRLFHSRNGERPDELARCLRTRRGDLTVDTGVATFRIGHGALVTQGEI